jgi:hypothetical protein
MLALLDGGKLVRSASSAGSASRPPAPAPVGDLQQQLLAASPRKLRAEERGFVRQVERLYEQAHRIGHVSGWELQGLFPGVFRNYWEVPQLWPEFPKSAHEFWLYVAFAVRERGQAVPEFMEPITDLAPVEKIMRRWRRREQIGVWERTLEQAGLAAPGGGRGALDFRLLVGHPDVRLEWKPAGGQDFQPLKQTQLRRFADEYSAGSLEVLPEAHPLWYAFFHRWDYSRYLDWHLTSPEVKRALNHLLRLPGLHERVVTSSGAPFVRVTEPLRWQMEPAQSEDEDYQFRLVLPDGSPAPTMLLTLPGQPTLYVSATTIYTGPAERSTVLDVTKVNSIPAPALETRQGMEFLHRLGVELPPRLRERTRQVAMRVKVACVVKPTYPGSKSEVVSIRVTAESEAGDRAESFTAAGWQPDISAAKPKRKNDDGTIYLHDRAPLEEFSRLFEPLEAKWDGYMQSWRVRLSKNFPEKFVPWLESLPATIEVQLDRELVTLQRAPVDASVKLDCTEAGVDWFDLKVALNVSDTELTPQELKALLDARGRFVRLGNKGWRRLRFNITEEEDQRLARLGLSPHDFSSEPQRLHALQLADEAAAKLLPETQVAQIQRRAGELKTRVTPPLPAAVRAELRPYQVEGFNFLAYLATNRFGGILADDMGLGKTLQSLTWLAWLRSQPEFQSKPTLVVCPKSVMDNWHAEAGRFVPELRVKIWHGTEASALTGGLDGTDLVVINYTQLRALAEGLANVFWHAVILDEGQYIKNPESQTARVARGLKADYRLVLTGTPIENRLLDLWSLMAFAMPGVLGNRVQFGRRFSQADDPLARRRLSARVRPFLLRRTKAQVARDLPDRIEEDLLCEMEGGQRTLYRAELKRARQILLNIKTRQDLDRERFHFLTSLLRLRQVCCHPALYDSEAKAAESAKLNALVELLEPLMDEGHKVLVFSQFVGMLEILRSTVQQRGWPHFYLAGDTENRGELVDSFQKAPGAAVFLVSLKAGGFGLNLTAASYVVLFDPWWNPAVETQAIDRTHRIGQTSKVIAYRLLIKDSIEEKIRALQRAKRALAEDVLGEESFTQGLTLEDLRFLFADDLA